MLYIEINNGNELQRYFQEADRDYYSIEAYDAMVELFEDSETNYELDVIAICCDFNELTLEEFINDYSVEVEEEDLEEAVINYLDNNAGYYRMLDNGKVFYQVF